MQLISEFSERYAMVRMLAVIACLICTIDQGVLIIPSKLPSQI